MGLGLAPDLPPLPRLPPSPTAMVELDGDEVRISSRGKLAERDIVQVKPCCPQPADLTLPGGFSGKARGRRWEPRWPAPQKEWESVLGSQLPAVPETHP